MTAPAGTSFVTTAPAPISALGPTRTPGSSVTFAPIRAPRSMIAPRQPILDASADRVARVGDHHPRSQPAVILQHTVFGHENAAVQADTTADHDMMFNDAVRADADMIADLIVLADDDVMTGLQTDADDVSRVDHGVRADDAARAQDQRFLARLRAARRLAQDDEVVDLCIVR